MASLWLSQVCRAGGDAGLRLLVVLLGAEGSAAQRESTWHLVTALFMLPCILLAPVNGALANSLPRRGLLAASAAATLAVLLAAGLQALAQPHHAWSIAVAAVALAALGSAVYGPTRLALLPAAARDSHWPLARVTAAIEAGAVLAMVCGMVGITQLMMPGALSTSAMPTMAAATAGPAWAALWALSALCLLSALPARFRADVSRAEPPAQALRGFFRDARRIAANRPACAALLSLAGLRGLAAVAVGALIAAVLVRHGSSTASAFQLLLGVALLAMLGTGAGSALAGALGGRLHGPDAPRWLARGLLPLAAAGLALALLGMALAAEVPLWPGIVVGLLGGLVNVPLLVRYQQTVPDDARGNAMAILGTAGHVAMATLSLSMAWLSAAGVLSATGQLLAAAALAAAGGLLAWRLQPVARHGAGAV